MVAYADTSPGQRRVSPRQPAWGELSLGLVTGGLVVALGLSLAPHAFRDRSDTLARGDRGPLLVSELRSHARQHEARRRFEAFAREAHLSATQRRALLSALGDLQETWAGAVGYFDALEEEADDLTASVGLLDRAHADELNQVVTGAAAARLGRLLGPAAGALAERRLGPLASFVAAAPSY